MHENTKEIIMSSELNSMSVLPVEVQEEINRDFSWELLAEKLSDYVVELSNELALANKRLSALDVNESLL